MICINQWVSWSLRKKCLGDPLKLFLSSFWAILIVSGLHLFHFRFIPPSFPTKNYVLWVPFCENRYLWSVVWSETICEIYIIFFVPEICYYFSAQNSKNAHKQEAKFCLLGIFLQLLIKTEIDDFSIFLYPDHSFRLWGLIFWSHFCPWIITKRSSLRSLRPNYMYVDCKM